MSSWAREMICERTNERCAGEADCKEAGMPKTRTFRGVPDRSSLSGAPIAVRADRR